MADARTLEIDVLYYVHVIYHDHVIHHGHVMHVVLLLIDRQLTSIPRDGCSSFYFSFSGLEKENEHCITA